jgi:hypothetical protein
MDGDESACARIIYDTHPFFFVPAAAAAFLGAIWIDVKVVGKGDQVCDDSRRKEKWA